MSKLIDQFVKENYTSTSAITQVNIGNKWYLAKPVQYISYKTFLQRFKDVFKVFTGKAIAVHYKEDE